MASNQSQMTFVHGPARRPEWAQMIRLGGDRVAVLFEELRKSLGKVDGIVERLSRSGREAGWAVRYDVSGAVMLTARISPGLLEVDIPLNPSERESLLRTRGLGERIKVAIRSLNNEDPNLLTLPLTDRRAVLAVANLVRVKSRLALKAATAVH